MKKQKRVREILAQNNFSVNNNQFACAVAALCDSRHRRNFLSIPPGKGKSRVIVAVIVLRNEYSGTKDFTIVFTTELLKSVD